jgi:hypothetical protein
MGPTVMTMTGTFFTAALWGLGLAKSEYSYIPALDRGTDYAAWQEEGGGWPGRDEIGWLSACAAGNYTTHVRYPTS